MAFCSQSFGGPILNYGTPNPQVIRLQVRIDGQVQDAPQGFQIPDCNLPTSAAAVANLSANQVSMLTQLATLLGAAGNGEYTITKTGTTLTLGSDAAP